ncbi:copper resistance protein CopC [Streptomyces sp. HNM0575]|uniref:copper resistance CopC family protein n=1 Tax=Streptomyces sp. HNM0575 TaxID=2716338 RepID=UPI003216FE3F
MLLVFGAPAQAHSPLQEATPAPGSKVGTGTSVISLKFPGLASGSTPKVKLTGAKGASVPVGKPEVADDSVVCASVGRMRAGVTTLTYRVSAADGDRQTNSFQFEVADGAKAAAAPDACQGLHLAKPAPAAERDGSDTILGIDRTVTLVLFAAATVVVLGGVALALRTTRKARSA